MQTGYLSTPNAVLKAMRISQWYNTATFRRFCGKIFKSELPNICGRIMFTCWRLVDSHATESKEMR